MVGYIKNIIQIKIYQGKINIWKFFVALFFMAVVSIFFSFFMDKKLAQKNTNDTYLEQLKSTFVANKKMANDLKDQIMIQAKEKSFGFIEPKKEDVIIIY